MSFCSTLISSVFVCLPARWFGSQSVSQSVSHSGPLVYQFFYWKVSPSLNKVVVVIIVVVVVIIIIIIIIIIISQSASQPKRPVS